MNRVCLCKGQLIEMQSGGYEHPDPSVDQEAYRKGNLDVLVKNALNAGYKEDEIEVKWITDEEWAVMQEEINSLTPEQVAEKEREEMIQSKIREIAIKALQDEGKLPVTKPFT